MTLSTTNVDYGKFGKDILVEYCGSKIADQFYNVENPMLLTEHQMAVITTQNIVEYIVFALIAVLIQVVFRLYFRTITICYEKHKSQNRNCCNNKCKKHKQKTASTSNNKISEKVKLRIEKKRKKLKWNKKPLIEWTTDNVIQWINSIEMDTNLTESIITEITNCACDGKDIIALKSVDEFDEAFNISNKELCDKMFKQLLKFKTNGKTQDLVPTNIASDAVETKEMGEEEESIISFNINIFSHDKNMTLNEKVKPNCTIQRVKQIYKAELGIKAKLEDIQLYSKSKLLSPENTLAEVGIVDERHLISVKYEVDGADKVTNPMEVAVHSPETTQTGITSNDYLKIVKIIAIIWSVLLAFLIMFHFINGMINYYAHVDEIVKFPQNTLYMDSIDECIEFGVGRLPCPELFAQYNDEDSDEGDNEGYSLQNAENACKWIYNILIITNPAIFQYSLLASFWIFDCVLYFLIMFIVSFVPALCCNCCAWATCWCGCCCTDCCTTCCAVTHCCTEIGWCCADKICCYCSCGIFGPFLWFIQFLLALILIVILLVPYNIVMIIIGFILSIFGLVIVYVFTSPLSIVYPKIFCCFVFETFIGNGREVDLRVNVIHHNDAKLTDKLNRLWSDLIRVDNVCKNPISMRKVSVVLSILNPLLVIVIISFVHTFISGFMIYYVIDGGIYAPWFYFKPFWEGWYHFIVSFGFTITDIEMLSNYFQHIAYSSISWKEFINLNSDFDSIKYSVLLIRTILHIFVGIIDTIANQY